MRSAPAAALALSLAAAGSAAAGDYRLQPEEIAPGVHVLWGAQEEVSPANGGNIANIGFIVGNDAVLAVDVGPTRLYGEQLLDTIAATAGLPVRYAAITHHHFDHAFGLSAFRDAGVTTIMHRRAARWLAREGSAVRENIARLAGDAWMEGTGIVAADRLIEADMEVDLGGRIVEISVLGGGHSAGDLTVADRRTGTLFAGDLVFHGRVPSLPHGDVGIWQAQLAALAGGDWTRLVPGHGPLVTDRGPLDALSDYIGFVRDHVACSFLRGDSRAEALLADLPERHAGLALIQREFQRSVFQLWRKYEAAPPPPCP